MRLEKKSCGDSMTIGFNRSPLQAPVWLGVLFVLIASMSAQSQSNESQSNESRSVSEIVDKLMAQNRVRAGSLRHLTCHRTYHVEYHGFPHGAEASMEVEAIYQAPSSKTFKVVKESGSGLLLNRVLKRLLKSEEEAAHKQDENALTPANYNFSLVGTEVFDDRPMYILYVEPKVTRQLLFRGRVWVDAQDFAVAKVEAQPAQNPSFWIKNTQIHHLYAKVGNLWLPQVTKSETKVRLGGVATLTIQYADYQVESAQAM